MSSFMVLIVILANILVALATPISPPGPSSTSTRDTKSDFQWPTKSNRTSNITKSVTQPVKRLEVAESPGERHEARMKHDWKILAGIGSAVGVIVIAALVAFFLMRRHAAKKVAQNILDLGSTLVKRSPVASFRGDESPANPPRVISTSEVERKQLRRQNTVSSLSPNVKGEDLPAAADLGTKRLDTLPRRLATGDINQPGEESEFVDVDLDAHETKTA